MSPTGWIAVASAAHVRIGCAGGFMQVCHGKGAPLKRLRPGDRVVYYSPGERMGEGSTLQAFTAIGRVRDAAVVQHDMGDGFVPWRREVSYASSRPAPIRPLLDQLAFTRGEKHWGARFRYGLFEVSEQDMRCIAEAMRAPLDALGFEQPALIAA